MLFFENCFDDKSKVKRMNRDNIVCNDTAEFDTSASTDTSDHNNSFIVDEHLIPILYKACHDESKDLYDQFDGDSSSVIHNFEHSKDRTVQDTSTREYDEDRINKSNFEDPEPSAGNNDITLDAIINESCAITSEYFEENSIIPSNDVADLLKIINELRDEIKKLKTEVMLLKTGIINNGEFQNRNESSEFKSNINGRILSLEIKIEKECE